MDIGAWLRGLGLGRYEQAFRDSDVDDRVLPGLTAEDLKEIGVASVGHRRLIQQAAAALPAAAAVAEPEAAPAERRQLTVMFADLVGSAALSARLDPEELREVLRAYQGVAAGAIGRFEGHVAKFMGDGVLAYFGWPEAHEDDAERAVRAALALLDGVGRLRTPAGESLAARVGIATGLVVVGDLLGEGAAREETVVGETPNLAARLQAVAAPGWVVVAEGTRRLLGSAFEVETLDPRPLKGLGEAVRAFRVLAGRPARTRFEARQTGAVLPLVGREPEFALLLERWRLARAGQGQAVLLSGEPGIGKSRLAEALADALAREPHVAIRHQCSPQRAGSPLWPVAERLGIAAGFASGDDDAARLGKLEALLRPGAGDAAEAAALLAPLLGIERAGRHPALDGLTPRQRRARALAALADHLVGLAAGRPALILFEDVQWIDPTSLELVEQVLERIAGSRVLVLLTSRPEGQPRLGDSPRLARLVLGRLGHEASSDIIREAGLGKPLPPDLEEAIARRADGVPLFVEELTKAVLETGQLRETEGGWVLEGVLPVGAIPSSLQASLMARLDRLASAKRVAQVAACIGREFDHALLAAVLPLPAGELDAALERLVASELVSRRAGGAAGAYAFKHALVQDTAYDTLLRGKRQQLHTRIAAVVEERFPETAQAQPELLAHHLTAAGLVEKAVAYWHEAGRRASERSAVREAIAHLTKGLELIRSLSETSDHARQELALHLTLGPVLSAKSWAAPEVEQTYLRARELCRRVGQPSELFTATWGLWIVYAQRGQFGTARGLVEELVGLAERQSEPAFLLQAHHAGWTTFDYQGELLLAREHAERGFALYRPDEHRSHKFLYGGHDPEACSLNHLAFVLWSLGYPDQALAKAFDALRLAHAASHAFTLAITQLHTIILRQFRREPHLVRDGAAETTALSAEHGFAHNLAMATILRGWALAAEGHADEGLAEIRHGLAAVRATGTELRRSYYLVLFAEACGWAGHVEHGLGALAEAHAFVEKTGERRWEAEIHRLQGELLARSTASRAEAETRLHQAIEVARRQGARSLELRAATSLAGLWVERGERRQARDLLAPVYDWFAEGFDTPDLRAAKALLQELTSGPPSPQAGPRRRSVARTSGPRYPSGS